MILQIIKKIWKHGIVNSTKIITHRPRLRYWNWVTRNAPDFIPPNENEPRNIENELIKLGISVKSLLVSKSEFITFKNQNWFPDDYHGGRQSYVWNEKHLEHLIASKLLNLFDFNSNDTYVDVASSTSPWALELKNRHKIESYAIDLKISDTYANLSNYLSQDATKSSFPIRPLKERLFNILLKCFR